MLAVTLFAFVACTDKGDEWEIPFDYDAKIQYSTIGYDQATNIITTAGDTKKGWVAKMDDATAKWCSFDQKADKPATSGYAGDKITIYISKNESAETRTANITVTFNNSAKTVCNVSFTQYGYSANAGYDRDWGEQPANTQKGNNLIYKTYYTTLASGSAPVRNYSVCYDTEKMVSRWVAYPVHDLYVNGSNGRSDAWAFDDAQSTKTSDGYRITSTTITSPDNNSQHCYNTFTRPIIPHEFQQNIVAGSYGDQTAVRYLNRGHMLPSATRQKNWESNAQTYYATNMMPQNGNFNSGPWAVLEGYVRKTQCSDTLYVVVGTLFEQGATQITSRGRKITVPSHCFKLMLRTKSGKTGMKISEITDANDLQAIGFLFVNDDIYANPSSQTEAQQKQVIKNAAISISDIEKRAGFTFFNNINPQIADQVKSNFNINDWSAIR